MRAAVDILPVATGLQPVVSSAKRLEACCYRGKTNIAARLTAQAAPATGLSIFLASWKLTPLVSRFAFGPFFDGVDAIAIGDEERVVGSDGSGEDG
jgi:hypothetical protein